MELKERHMLEVKNKDLNEKLLDARKGLLETGSALLKVQQATEQLMNKREQKDLQLQRALESHKQYEIKIADLETKLSLSEDGVKLHATVSSYRKIINDKDDLIIALEKENSDLKSAFSKAKKEFTIGDQERAEHIQSIESLQRKAASLEAIVKKLETSKAALESSKASLEAEKAELDFKSKELSSALVNANKAIQSLEVQHAANIAAAVAAATVNMVPAPTVETVELKHVISELQASKANDIEQIEKKFSSLELERKTLEERMVSLELQLKQQSPNPVNAPPSLDATQELKVDETVKDGSYFGQMAAVNGLSPIPQIGNGIVGWNNANNPRFEGPSLSQQQLQLQQSQLPQQLLQQQQLLHQQQQQMILLMNGGRPPEYFDNGSARVSQSDYFSTNSTISNEPYQPISNEQLYRRDPTYEAQQQLQQQLQQQSLKPSPRQLNRYPAPENFTSDRSYRGIDREREQERDRDREILYYNDEDDNRSTRGIREVAHNRDDYEEDRSDLNSIGSFNSKGGRGVGRGRKGESRVKSDRWRNSRDDGETSHSPQHRRVNSQSPTRYRSRDGHYDYEDDDRRDETADWNDDYDRNRNDNSSVDSRRDRQKGYKGTSGEAVDNRRGRAQDRPKKGKEKQKMESYDEQQYSGRVEEEEGENGGSAMMDPSEQEVKLKSRQQLKQELKQKLQMDSKAIMESAAAEAAAVVKAAAAAIAAATAAAAAAAGNAPPDGKKKKKRPKKAPVPSKLEESEEEQEQDQAQDEEKEEFDDEVPAPTKIKPLIDSKDSRNSAAKQYGDSQLSKNKTKIVEESEAEESVEELPVSEKPSKKVAAKKVPVTVAAPSENEIEVEIIAKKAQNKPSNREAEIEAEESYEQPVALEKPKGKKSKQSTVNVNAFASMAEAAVTAAVARSMAAEEKKIAEPAVASTSESAQSKQNVQTEAGAALTAPSAKRKQTKVETKKDISSNEEIERAPAADDAANIAAPAPAPASAPDRRQTKINSKQAPESVTSSGSKVVGSRASVTSKPNTSDKDSLGLSPPPSAVTQQSSNPISANSELVKKSEMDDDAYLPAGGEVKAWSGGSDTERPDSSSSTGVGRPGDRMSRPVTNEKRISRPSTIRRTVASPIANSRPLRTPTEGDPRGTLISAPSGLETFGAQSPPFSSGQDSNSNSNNVGGANQAVVVPEVDMSELLNTECKILAAMWMMSY